MRRLFLTSSANQVMSDLVKHLPKKPKDYHLAFITTAAEVEKGDHWWLKADRDSLLLAGFKIDEFSISNVSKAELKKRMSDTNGIFVCGGNTFYLLDQTIQSGFNRILVDKINSGDIYIGSSAGSMIVGKRIDLISTIDDKSKAPNLKSDGLAIIDLAVLPHWGSPDFESEYKKGMDAMYAENIKIIPLSNRQYLLIEGEVYRIIQT